MTTTEQICREVPGLTEATLRHWVEQDWVHPPDEADFHDIDVARVRLIVELRTLEVEEPTLPLVLSLLDQLYATRQKLRAVLENLDAPALEKVRQGLLF